MVMSIKKPKGWQLSSQLHSHTTANAEAHAAFKYIPTLPTMAPYDPPISLVVLGTTFIGLALIAALIDLLDILYRRGWRSMVGVILVFLELFLCSSNL